jgi:carbon monoxide dehydrogenase subunit G
MSHLEVSATTPVAATPEQAWEVLSDTARYAEWVEGTIEVTRTDGPTAPGSTYDEINPVLGPWKAKTHWTVTEFDPPRLQVHSAEGIPGANSFEVVMEVVPVADACEVTMRLRGETGLGPLGAVFGALQKGRLQKQVQSAVDSLAERLATGQPAGQPAG